jgi:ribose transport system ATP-binding protein
MTALFLELTGIGKSFGTTRALDDVSFELERGEVHALVGENGAGKSTLLGVLSGAVSPDRGTITLHGAPVTIASPARAQALGIGMVFQELSLAGSVSVAENIFAGRLPTSAGCVRWGELRRRAREVLAPFDAGIDVTAPVEQMPVGRRQLVEIAKALSLRSQILLLDEPTSALASDEVEVLFQIIRRLKARGIGIIYVSHHLTEVFRIADRVTVLRDGRLVTTRNTAETSVDQVILEMIGRRPAALKATAVERGAPILAARGLSRRGEFAGIDLILHQGEVVGLAGLIGARRSELARTLAGILPPHSGTIELHQRPIRLRGLRMAKRSGIAYVPEERKTDGLFLTRSVIDNVVVTALRRFTRFGVLSGRQSRTAAQAAIERFRIRAQAVIVSAGKLSGGNQQKLMLSKWLAIDPAVIIIDSPTRGVDIESKLEIHREIRRLAAAGKAVLIISSDVPELFAVTDRIVVMCEGRIVGQGETQATTQEEVVALAAGNQAVVMGEAA